MMIDWLVRRIFSWKPLYDAVTEEVHLYDMLKERSKDTTPGSLHWNDGDGWRSWTYSPERNKYYFNDIPTESLGESMRYILESVGPEFDMDEVW
jgi:hypothetical protein